jgi:transposase
MSPRLPKEVVAAIELAINIAQARGLRPDLEGIATIFNTTYKSVTLIRRRINTIASTGIDPRKKAGPKPLGGVDQDEIERCIRELTARNEEVDLNGIARVVKERFGIEMGRSTVSRFIKARSIPFIGGKGGPKGNGGTGRGRKPGPRRRPQPVLVDQEAAGTLSQLAAAPDSSNYSSPYTESIAAQNAVELPRTYSRPPQNPAVYGPYS